MQNVGVGELGGQGGAGDIAGQGGHGTVVQRILVEIGGERCQHIGVRRAEFGQQPVAGADHFGKERVLGLEMGVEAAPGEAGRQHDVVDIGSGIAAQPEQAGGVSEEFGSDTGGMGGARRHFMSIIISYDYRHIKRFRRSPRQSIVPRWWRRRARRG